MKLRELDKSDVKSRLGYGSYVGRVGFTAGDEVVIYPVNYLYESGNVYIRTAAGSGLTRLEGRRVAFEVDQNHPLEHAGWSVLAHGIVSVVHEATELEKLRRGPLRSWARERADTWLKIVIDEVAGRDVGSNDTSSGF